MKLHQHDTRDDQIEGIDGRENSEDSEEEANEMQTDDIMKPRNKKGNKTINTLYSNGYMFKGYTITTLEARLRQEAEERELTGTYIDGLFTTHQNMTDAWDKQEGQLQDYAMPVCLTKLEDTYELIEGGVQQEMLMKKPLSKLAPPSAPSTNVPNRPVQNLPFVSHSQFGRPFVRKC